MLSMSSLSTTQKRLILMAVLLVVLIVAVVLGAVMKSISIKNADDEFLSLKEAVTERFSSFQPHDKNQVYNSFIKKFYSSSSNPVSYTIMFTPSVTDVACTNFSSSIQNSIPCGTDEGSAPIDSVSIRENRPSMGLRPYEVCGSRSAATGPLDPQDAHLRILTNVYSLRKTCVQLPYIALVENNQSQVTVHLPTESPATLFFVMARPVFLSTSTSYIYSVTTNLDQVEYSYGYETPGSTYLAVTLDRVDEEMMYEVGTKITKRNIQDVYENVSDGLMNATLYFLNYEHPVRRGLSNVEFTTINEHAMTMMFAITKKKMLQPDDWLNLNNPDIRVSFNNENSRVYVAVNGKNTADMKIDGHGYFIITYATNSLILCYMSRGRVKMRRVEDVQNLDISTQRKTAITEALEASNAKPPQSCYPCSTFSIPNFYDLYTKLVAFS